MQIEPGFCWTTRGCFVKHARTVSDFNPTDTRTTHTAAQVFERMQIFGERMSQPVRTGGDFNRTDTRTASTAAQVVGTDAQAVEGIRKSFERLRNGKQTEFCLQMGTC